MALRAPARCSRPTSGWCVGACLSGLAKPGGEAACPLIGDFEDAVRASLASWLGGRSGSPCYRRFSVRRRFPGITLALIGTDSVDNAMLRHRMRAIASSACRSWDWTFPRSRPLAPDRTPHHEVAITITVNHRRRMPLTGVDGNDCVGFRQRARSAEPRSRGGGGLSSGTCRRDRRLAPSEIAGDGPVPRGRRTSRTEPPLGILNP